MENDKIISICQKFAEDLSNLTEDGLFQIITGREKIYPKYIKLAAIENVNNYERLENAIIKYKLDFAITKDLIRQSNNQKFLEFAAINSSNSKKRSLAILKLESIEVLETIVLNLNEPIPLEAENASSRISQLKKLINKKY